MSEFKLNRNYENTVRTKNTKIKNTETIMDGSKGLYIKIISIEKDDKEVKKLVKVTIKENDNKKFSLRIKTLDDKETKEMNDLKKEDLLKKLSDKKMIDITTNSVVYIKKDMSTLRKGK